MEGKLSFVSARGRVPDEDLLSVAKRLKFLVNTRLGDFGVPALPGLFGALRVSPEDFVRTCMSAGELPPSGCRCLIGASGSAPESIGLNGLF